MTKASRVILAKQLIYCAKMVLDAGQFKEAKAIQAGNNASIVRGAIQHYLPGIIEDANRNNVSTSNYVFHHLYGTKDKHYVGTDAKDLTSKDIAQDVRHALMLCSNSDYQKSMINNYIKKNQNSKRKPRKEVTIEYLQRLKTIVEDQVNNCVILPKLFHDWLHHQIDDGDGNFTIKSNGEKIKLTSREACYQFLNRYRSDKKRLHELINQDFENSSLNQAIKSLYRLISLSRGTQEKEYAIERIKDAFDNIQEQIINHNIVSENIK